MATKASYGIDAPYVVRNLLLAAAFFLVVSLALPSLKIGPVIFLLYPGLLWPAGWFALGGGFMLFYSLVGKFRHRDRMLAKVPWTGAERVLDVGSGRGLLLIGVAKRLDAAKGGHATGIDIWNTEDLSGNGPQGLRRNLELEGVADRATIRSEDARAMSFADSSFDIVMSNMCLHNIYDRSGRAKALREVARVLKPGGVAVLSDYKLVQEYADELAKCSLTVITQSLDWGGCFPPLRILVARKAH